MKRCSFASRPTLYKFLCAAAFAAWLSVMLVLSACQTNPIIVVATQVPLDANFKTYRHASGVFSLRLPTDWSVRDVSQGDAVHVEFSPPNNPGLPLTVYVINTGSMIDASHLLDSLNKYQAAINGDPNVYAEISRTAQGDGSWRLTGVRQTPIGARQINTFLQADKTFLSALEVDVTGADDALIQTIRAVINTYRVDANSVINPSALKPGTVGVTTSSGVLEFGGLLTWNNKQSAFIINGTVTNHAGNALEAIRITAILYDAQGTVLAEQANVVPVELLDDGATAPFSIQFTRGKPSQAVRYELQAASRGAEYALKTHLSDSAFIKGNDKATYNAAGYLTVSGDVVNRTQGVAHFVKVTVTVFDDQQRVVASDNVFIAKQDLLPGETAHFEVPFFELGGGASRYVISVEGKSDG